MTTLTSTWFKEPAAGLKTFAHRVMQVLEGIAEGRALASRYDELARLSDSELAQRGIKREDIARVALGGRYFI